MPLLHTNPTVISMAETPSASGVECASFALRTAPYSDSKPKTMSNDELRKLERDMLQWIAEQAKPVSHDAVVEWAHKIVEHASPSTVRNAVWRLVGDEKLAFDRDWHLKAS